MAHVMVDRRQHRGQGPLRVWSRSVEGSVEGWIPSRTWREEHHCSATIARTLRASSSDIVVSCFGQSLTETRENTCSTTVLPTRGLILLTRRPSTQSPAANVTTEFSQMTIT